MLIHSEQEGRLTKVARATIKAVYFKNLKLHYLPLHLAVANFIPRTLILAAKRFISRIPPAKPYSTLSIN